MKYFALSIGGGGGTPLPTYSIALPGQIQRVADTSIQTIIQNGISLLLYVAIILSLIFVMVGGLRWMLSQGDKKGVEEARKTIMYAIVGLVIAFFAFFIINLIGYLFGVTLLGGA